MLLNNKIIIAGGTGFMGQALARHLLAQGYQVIILSRQHQVDEPNLRYVKWGGSSQAWQGCLEGAKAVINLCGRSVDCRYTEKNKQAIYDSRLIPTQTLGEAIKACDTAPDVWLNASTATYYRHAMDRPMTEQGGERGEGFSVDVATKWEEAFYAFDLPYTRRVALRTAIVLGNSGGALPVMKRLARWGLGGRQGSGRQMVSWIHIEDFCRSVAFLIEQDDCQGGYNLAAPGPLPNERFMKKVARAFGPGWGLPTPRALLEAGAVMVRTETELILKSRWVLPERLLQDGFQFTYPDIDTALVQLQKRQALSGACQVFKKQRYILK